MKILITGTQGLAKALAKAYSTHLVVAVSRTNGYDINDIEQWGHEFLNYDCVFNCAYDGFAQVSVLEFFYRHWSNDSSKKIVSIGSRCIAHKRTENIDGYWPYKLHKAALQSAHDSMQVEAKCDLKIFNPGPIDTTMVQHLSVPKFDADQLAQTIKVYCEDASIKRLDFWM